ncbi:hypothetical protein [Chamaesiphon minutus]|uniref:Uncharacterized protein n=1 Tax=Chamaesiphon minutus (strain ATCC 27169 / PCC 6605) TaxID=1173020 RepID=K9UFV1_CHAP6|nr:hypothetical protein [Chamaesiphon minutus]AFY93271.1 hypothetical protein Cha6605_2188 [Chamaesiphon minutus PCC 6605]
MKPIANFVVRVNVQQQSRLLSRKNVLLSCLLLIGIFLGATDAAFAGSTSVANPATKVNDLLRPGIEKKPPVVKEPPVINTSNILADECSFLGGKILEGGNANLCATKQMCVINGNAVCITK